MLPVLSFIFLPLFQFGFQIPWQIQEFFRGDICSFILQDILRYRPCYDPVPDVVLSILLPLVVIYLYADVAAKKMAHGSHFAKLLFLFIIFFVIVWYGYYGYFAALAWFFLVLMMAYYAIVWPLAKKREEERARGVTGGGAAERARGLLGGLASKAQRRAASKLGWKPVGAMLGLEKEREVEYLQMELDSLEKQYQVIKEAVHAGAAAPGSEAGILKQIREKKMEIERARRG